MDMRLIKGVLLLLSLSRCGQGFHVGNTHLAAKKHETWGGRHHQRSQSGARRSPSSLQNFSPFSSPKPEKRGSFQDLSDSDSGNKTRSSRDITEAAVSTGTNRSVGRDVDSPSLSDLETVEFPDANVTRMSFRQGNADTLNDTSLVKAGGGPLIVSQGNRSYKTSVLGTYFPFFQTSANTNDHIAGSLSSGKNVTSRDAYQKMKKSNVANSVNITRLLADKNPNDTITVADLEMIFSSVSIGQLSGKGANIGLGFSETSSDAKTGGGATSAAAIASGSKSGGNSKRPQQVAFPQPSVLSYRDVQRGSSAAGGVLGILLGVTVLPNLWLVGMLLGAAYGYDIAKAPIEGEGNNMNNPNVIARFVIYTGRNLAKTALQLYDYGKAMWFLYKTGQLSYEYYKRYESLDQRFAIQSKMDAWNARFAEGKKRFDAWEQENEVGRTLLAGLRTVWLVDEQARRRANEKSRYRLIQSLYDVKYWMGRWLVKVRLWYRTQFQRGGTIQEFFQGVRLDITSQGSMGARFGAAVAAVVAVNIGGAIFSISPAFSNLLAIIFAIVWPSWASDVASRVRDIGEEFQAKGRGEDTGPGTLLPRRSASFRRYDKSRYHFFVQADGKTKRFYRTGQSMFSQKRRKQEGDKSKNTSVPWLDSLLRRSDATDQRKTGFWDFFSG